MESPALSRLCVHTITTKPFALPEAIETFTQAGVSGITVWRDALQPLGLNESSKLLKKSGMEVVSLCRGGFFTGSCQADREKAIEDNKRAIDEAHAVGAPLVVLVCGAVPGVPLPQARKQIQDGIAAVIPYAQQANVKLAIEPLHPMYADSRSAINTMAQANDMVERLASPWVGIAVDVYHLWWDDQLESEITRCGKMNKIFAYHVCDWRTPTRDLLLDRGLMGGGCIPLKQIRSWVERAGFNGMIEVEIFSNTYWAMDQKEFLKKIVTSYQEHV